MDIRDLLDYEHEWPEAAKSSPMTVLNLDPDIIGGVVGQAELLSRGLPNAAGAKMDGIYHVTGNVSLKLSALRYHARQFRERQEKRTAEITADPKVVEIIKRGITVTEKELLFEFEAFFFQFKSTLDMLVKLFVPVFGSKTTDVPTYGKNGTHVIKFLEQLKKNKKLKLHAGRVDHLAELIREAIDPWLKPLVAIRDTVSHYKSHIGIGFTWDREKEQLGVPMANFGGTELPLADVMRNVAELMIGYSVEFVARTILCGVPISIYYHPLNEMERRYISASWGRDLGRAVWNLSSNVLYDYTEKDIEDAHTRRKLRHQQQRK